VTARTANSAADILERPAPDPRWVRVTSLTLCLLGLLISAYLTIEHYSASRTLACPESATINCVKVTTSSYSRFLGAPVALLGLAYYVAMTGLCSPPAWATRIRIVRVARLVGAVAGVVAVIYLIWAELFRLDAICLWCTAVHAITLALFAALALATALGPVETSVSPAGPGPAAYARGRSPAGDATRRPGRARRG
jgi:uncharacterized membrane protein